ncbi:MAG: hypothetical protein U0793_19275 [Gemmataceae bacterium]
MLNGLRLLCFLFLGAALSLGSTGCGKKEKSPDATGGSKLTQENFDKIKMAMAEKDVIDILGPATETKDITGGKELTWKSGMSNVTLEFKEGKVTGKSGAIVTVK